MSRRLFTSESVTEGHPDKIADQISDSVLDALLAQDPRSRVAVETLLTTGLVVVAGEVTHHRLGATSPQIVRDRILAIGYDSSKKGFDGRSCGVTVAIGVPVAATSPRASTPRTRAAAEGSVDPLDAQGAGDQGLMFGYACDDTPELMPLPITIAHRLAEQLSQARRDGTMAYLRPDGKTQVTVEYDADGRPVRVDTVVVSSQHAPDIDLDAMLTPDVKKHVVDEVLDRFDIDHADYRLLVNPTGRFEVGGPMGDAGLTGRKIIIDTYGGMARHGGGAFSGKDPSKVDRSAAYAMRWVAKNVVAAGLARPLRGAGGLRDRQGAPGGLLRRLLRHRDRCRSTRIADAVREVFDLRPAALIRDLDLLRPIYAQHRGLRPLRPRAARVHLGADRPGRRPPRRRPRLTPVARAPRSSERCAQSAALIRALRARWCWPACAQGSA